MKTDSIKRDDINRNWYVVDAKGATLGRLSSRIAHILRGKNKVNFTPNLDMSDFIIVVNANQVKLSGNKENNKEYWKHTGFPGGGSLTSYKLLKEKDAKKIIQKSVKGMLPHNKLGNKLIKHLKVYKGSNHPHGSQNPISLEF